MLNRDTHKTFDASLHLERQVCTERKMVDQHLIKVNWLV